MRERMKSLFTTVEVWSDLSTDQWFVLGSFLASVGAALVSLAAFRDVLMASGMLMMVGGGLIFAYCILVVYFSGRG